ncbi:MAG: type 2 isopentenyl-diphosphate Delta-isomerase [Candidatus Lokiarchaeota archaeon]|nr:type 2 isopentenyl-diphosphate Delta-isomerase [Candidatus Lokiarchaeota archaeon]
MPEKKSFEIMDRKLDHMKIPIEHDVQHVENYFELIKLIHHPYAEYNFNEIDISTSIFNKRISAPICISAITGGHPVATRINKILATAAEQEQIIMSVGSQRAGIEDPNLIDSFKVVRDMAPTTFIIGNIGIGQISKSDFEPEFFIKCIEMIKADAMAIHFNSLHELLQDNGDISYKLFEENFEKIKKKTKIPIIAKEVGSGFDIESAKRLENIGFNGFDVGGAGGTSFADIEYYRSNKVNEKYTRNPAVLFREWGNPTPVSVLYVRSISNLPIIATGGLKTGVDIAKSIVLGADIGGFASKFLFSSWKDLESGTESETIKEIKTLKHELQSCMWLLNVMNLRALKNNRKKRVFLGNLYQWEEQIQF